MKEINYNDFINDAEKYVEDCFINDVDYIIEFPDNVKKVLISIDKYNKANNIIIHREKQDKWKEGC